MDSDLLAKNQQYIDAALAQPLAETIAATAGVFALEAGAARLLLRRAHPVSGRVEDRPSAFLRDFCGPDTIVLMALGDGGPPIVRSFGDEANDEAIDAWITAQQQRLRNGYFTPGSVSRPMQKKPARSDIASCGWLWVDIDPRDGETPEQCKARVSDLSEPLRPTALVDSGNGIQAH